MEAEGLPLLPGDEQPGICLASADSTGCEHAGHGGYPVGLLNRLLPIWPGPSWVAFAKGMPVLLPPQHKQGAWPGSRRGAIVNTRMDTVLDIELRNRAS